MKFTTTVFTTLIATLFATGSIAAEQAAKQNATAEANAEAHAEANGNQTSTHKKTVTVTSDGKRTIKKTVEVRDGVERVTTEITDQNGKVTTTTDPCPDQKPPADRQDGPWLGVRVKEAPEILRSQLSLPEDRGAVIELVAPGGPADKAGIVKGDLLLTLAKAPIAGPDDLSAELQRHEVGETVELETMRRGETAAVNVTLEQRPADQEGDDPPPTPDYLLEDGPGNAGKAEVEIDGAGAGAGFDSILNNPDLPDDFKNTVREMQRKMRDFEKRHGNR